MAHHQIIVEIVLLLLLGGYGWTLGREIVREERRVAARIESNMLLGIGRYTGVDVTGRLLTPAASPGVDRVVTFLLRADRLGDDLAIWREVAHRVSDRRGVRIIGFCDDSQCARYVGAVAQPLGFTVMMYGEVVDSQAVLNADALAQCLVQKAGSEPFGVVWRGAGLTPGQISQRILD
jgi:hypothetical protein